MVGNITNTFKNLPSSPSDVDMKTSIKPRSNATYRTNEGQATNEHLFRKTLVETPRFEIDFSSVGVIRKYEIEIKKKSNGILTSLQMYPKNELVMIERKQLLQKIVTELLLTDRFPGNVGFSSVVYNRKRHIYTPHYIGQDRTSIIEFDKINDGQLKDQLGSNTEHLLIKLHLEKEFTPANNKDVKETKRFFRCLLHAEAYQQGYFESETAIYPACKEEHFRNGKTIKNGIVMNVKTSRTNKNKNKFYIEIKPKKSLFRKATNFLDYISHELEVEKLALHDVLLCSENREKLMKDINEMYVCSDYNRKCFRIHGLQKGNELMFVEQEKKKKIHRVQNFVMNNNSGLQYPHLPSIVRKQDDKISYYPIEKLSVPMGQRVNKNQLNSDSIAEANKNTTMLPLEYKKTIEEFMKSTLGNDNEYLKLFKVKVPRNMPQIQARTVVPPMVCYASHNMSFASTGNVDPTLTWDAKSHTHFIRPVKLTKWALLVLDNCVTKMECCSFANCLRQLGDGHHMQIEKESRLLFCDSNDEKCLKRQVNELVSGTLQILIVVARRATSAVAGTIKSIEVTTGLATHLFEQKDVLRTANGKGGASLILQLHIINAKCGGLNFDVNVPKGVACNMKEKDRLISNNLRRMYIGVQFKNCENQKTKAIGLTYTISNINEPKSMIWYEPSDGERIAELSTKVYDAIRQYERANGYRPTEIVVYRNLMKDDTVDVKAEFEQIKEKLLMACTGYRPSLTMLSVDREDNPTFLKTKIVDLPSACRQNVLPGLVVDCNEYGDPSFYLVSNKAEKGTLSSVKFSIVGTRPGYTPMLTMDEWKWVTNALAYANQFANSPGSVPFILTAAKRVAARALLALKIAIKEKRLNDPGSLERKLDRTDINERYRDITKQLKDNIEGRHW